ncbi:MAG: glycoside hydrolase family 3 C-terminal domain-containing protein [Oscillospiraceae bacterium]|nr:glycoside hydrolase family 3 C-terminal domain-containing protein [Oscillospiraceae bacterium]
MTNLRKVSAWLLTLVILTSCLSGCAVKPAPAPTPVALPAAESGSSDPSTGEVSVEEVLSRLTIEQKAQQMVQAAAYSVQGSSGMREANYGSLLSGGGSRNSVDGWKSSILDFQQGALDSDSGIAFVYGNDSVHGVNTVEGAVIFPHNIGIGAANDPELTYKMGAAVADESKISGMLWTFSPCVAAAQDPRWGRTYESYSSELEIIKPLSQAFAKGLIDNGVITCAKHYIGDGNVAFGTGEGGYLIDRGDAELSEAELDELLSVYKELIDSGTRTVMITHGSVNGVKTHGDKYLIIDLLKGELGFTGFVVSDWESIHNIPGNSLEEQVVLAVNAGIDMLMEPAAYEDCVRIIVDAVASGAITQERVDDAVGRILTVKKEAGIFADPMMENLETKQTQVGSDEYRDLARQLVEKSLVLLKNDGGVLPLKSGTKLYVSGPAANDTGVQCGGWTLSWLGERDNGANRLIPEAKTILDGLNLLAQEYSLTIITDPARASEADVNILCLGEIPYAEWEGDSADISITGSKALPENLAAIEESRQLGKPTVALLVAGRHVIYEEYESDWAAVVMCYLPGSEADGVANVLTGKSGFTGKLPMPYYSSTDDILTPNTKFDVGYGLSY